MSNHWTALHARVHQNLRERQLLEKNQRLLLAVSGGQDSVCLLRLMLDLQSRWQWQIAIAHCDHGWSSDAGISSHVKDLAVSWRVPYYVAIAPPELPEREAEARFWRYQALTEIAQAQGFTKVLTGHTLSDRAETLLYNLLRGSGTDGLTALTWKRSLTPINPNLELIRPLLNVSRQETGQFCQQYQLSIWEDAFNDNLQYARNRIRQQLIPELKTQFHPQIEANLAQTAEILRAEVDYLDDIAHQELTKLISPDNLSLNRIELRKQHLAIQRRIIRLFLGLNLSKQPNFSQIEAVINLIDAPNRSCTASFPGNITIQVQAEWLILNRNL